VDDNRRPAQIGARSAFINYRSGFRNRVSAYSNERSVYIKCRSADNNCRSGFLNVDRRRLTTDGLPATMPTVIYLDHNATTPIAPEVLEAVIT